MNNRRPWGPAALLLVLVCAGCGSAYLTLNEDPVRDLESSDPNLVALAALHLARAEKSEVSDASLSRLFALLEHRDALVRSAAALALRTLTGTAAGYQPYLDPQRQGDSIRSWRTLVERETGEVER